MDLILQNRNLPTKKIPKELSQFYKNINPWTDDTNLYQDEKSMEKDVIISVMPPHWCKS